MPLQSHVVQCVYEMDEFHRHSVDRTLLDLGGSARLGEETNAFVKESYRKVGVWGDGIQGETADTAGKWSPSVELDDIEG